MITVTLDEIVATFEISSDDHHDYLHTITGAIVEISTSQFRMAGARPLGMPPQIFPITDPSAKARLRAGDTPWISTIGPKGGASMAVAILRALLDNQVA